MLPKGAIEKGFWSFFYGKSFITNFPIFLKWHIIEPVSNGTGYIMDFTIMNLASILFSLTVALFCLSVPKEKRKKMLLPLGLSLVALLSNITGFIAQSMITDANANSSGITYLSLSESSMHVYSIAILTLGLSFMRLAVTYENNAVDMIKTTV